LGASALLLPFSGSFVSHLLPLLIPVVFLQRKRKSLGGDLVDPSNLFFSLGLESFGVLASLVGTFLLFFFSLLPFFL
jgi:hypothetical protein